jgi:hypothetical protein
MIKFKFVNQAKHQGLNISAISSKLLDCKVLTACEILFSTIFLEEV